MKRTRGRGRKPNHSGGQQSNRHFESSGPDIKIRGSASHVCDKYQQLARDAASSGNRIMAENYLQHAEHYLRIVQTQQQAQRERAEADAREREARAAAQPRPAEGETKPSTGAGGDAMAVVTPEASSIAAEDAAESQPAPRGRRPRRRAASDTDKAEAREALEAAGDGAPADPTAGA